MGNVSNPSINRWGVNTLWYSFWYSDISYSLNLKHDRIIKQLLNDYLHHGLSLPTLIFFSPYWYQTQLIPKNQPGYFRWLTTKNKTLGFKTTYRLRLETIDLFPMKLWILKYNNWVVINFYWFQPNKFKRKQRRFKFRPLEVTSTSFNRYVRDDKRRRLKSLVTFELLKSLSKPRYYLF